MLKIIITSLLMLGHLSASALGAEESAPVPVENISSPALPLGYAVKPPEGTVEKKNISPKIKDLDLEEIFNREYGIGQDLEPYRLHIGDRLYLSIHGQRNTGRAVTVDHTGSIYYLFIGGQFVLGKTLDELRMLLNKEINKYFENTFVSVTPIEFGSQSYTIFGQVKIPGKKVIQGKTSLLMAIAESGGFTEGMFRSQTIDLADLAHAFLARDGEYVPVDFRKLITEGDVSEDVELLNGDYIYIPNSLYKEIHVLGEVREPTTFGFINTVSLVEAIAQARGLTSRASSRILVIRGSLSNPQPFLIDINLILRGQEPDFLLQPGDIVFAPVMRLHNLKEVVKLGIRAFVADSSAAAGTTFYLHVNPRGKGIVTTPNTSIPLSPDLATPEPSFADSPSRAPGFN